MKTILSVEQLEAKQLLTTTTYTTDDVAVFADGEQPTPSEETVQQWAYTNTDGNKINWYIYSQDLTSDSLDQLKHVKNLQVKFSEFNSAGVGLYFTIYTAPQNDGHDAASWYRSRLNFTGDYTYTSDSSVEIDVSKAVAKLRRNYMPNRGRPGNYKVGLNLDPYSSRGPMDGEEILSYIAISTSSGQSAGTEDWAIKSAKIGMRGRPNYKYEFVTLNDNVSDDDNFQVINTGLLQYQVTVSADSPLVGQGFDSMILIESFAEDIMIWDAEHQRWHDPLELPTSSNPRELLRLLDQRIIEEGDVVYVTVGEDVSGSTPLFSYIGWNPITGTGTPTEILFAELGNNV